MRTAIEVACVVVGDVAASFRDCERGDDSVAIDVTAARAQHRGYVETLAGWGLAIQRVAADDRFPDCVFVEDAAVVLDATAAVIARPGVDSRRGEVDAVAASLPGQMVVHRVEAPATVDGGDVLRAGDRLFVGLSSRTNDAGAEALAAFASTRGVDCTPVRVPRGLHLKSACSLADETALVYDPRVGLELEPFVAAGLEPIAAPEPVGANVLSLGRRRVLVSAAAPRTAALLRGRSLEVAVVDVTEFHKADGALTCCSIRIPAPGAWAT